MFVGWSLLDGRHRNFVSWPRWVQWRRCIADGCGVVRLRQQRQIQARTPPCSVGRILIQRLRLRKHRDGLMAEAAGQDSEGITRLSWRWRGVPCDGVVGRPCRRRRRRHGTMAAGAQYGVQVPVVAVAAVVHSFAGALTRFSTLLLL